MNKKAIGIIVGIFVVVVVLAWAFVQSIKPLPGEVYAWNSRVHLPEGTQIDYKHTIQPNLPDNEPPTSGNHYPSWITKGFYDTPRPDGNLVHSQEHGYVIFWYNCDLASKLQSFNLIPPAYAQTQPLQMTSGSEGSASATLSQLPKTFSDGSCDSFENSIKSELNQLGNHKLVAVPRVGMDYPLILTAWGRLEKFNSFDTSKIKEFVDAFRDNGPEQTVEP